MPALGAPAKKGLVTEITERLLDGNMSPFEIASFKKKAHALKRSDVDNAFAALGILACIEGDLDECRKNHEISIRHTGFPSIQVANYANSLKYMGLYDEAVSLALKARHLDMNNLMALDIAITSCFLAGDEKRYLSFASDWKKQTGEDHRSYGEYLEEIKEANELTSCCMSAGMLSSGGCL